MIDHGPMVKTFSHNNRIWRIYLINRSYFYRDDKETLTGPFTTRDEATVAVIEIRAA